MDRNLFPGPVRRRWSPIPPDPGPRYQLNEARRYQVNNIVDSMQQRGILQPAGPDRPRSWRPVIDFRPLNQIPLPSLAERLRHLEAIDRLAARVDAVDPPVQPPVPNPSAILRAIHRHTNPSDIDSDGPDADYGEAFLFCSPY